MTAATRESLVLNGSCRTATSAALLRVTCSVSSAFSMFGEGATSSFGIGGLGLSHQGAVTQVSIRE